MRVQRIWLTLSTALLLTSVTTGCSSVSTPPPQGVTPQVSSTTLTGDGAPNSAYPGPGGEAYPGPGGEAYPGSDAQTQTAVPPGHAPEPIPTPATGMGVVHGQVYDQTANTPLYNGVMVHLSRVIPSDNPAMEAVSFDRFNDPATVPDTEGGFAFGNVRPGRYGIVVQAPLNQYLTRYADDKNKDVIISVEAGQTVNVGKILAGYP